MAGAVATFFHPLVEVILHDVATDSIIAMWNAFSARRPGDESLLDSELLSDVPVGHVLGPYGQIDNRGRSLSSVSVRLDEGRLLMCLNFDRSALDSVAQVLSRLAAPQAEQPRALFHRDWRAGLNALIDDWCREHDVTRDALKRGERVALVASLDEQGVFNTRNAAAHAAAVLGISRASVYALKKEAASRFARGR